MQLARSAPVENFYLLETNERNETARGGWKHMAPNTVWKEASQKLLYISST